MEKSDGATLKLIGLFLMGAVLWFVPVSSEITLQSWHLLVIFLCTMAGIVLNPLPISAIALLGASVCLISDTLTTEQVLHGFSDKVVWLLIFAFLIARAMIKTGLGKRVAYYFISKIGRTTLGLSYGLTLTEFLLSPVIPSITARGGGIIYPIAQSVAQEYGPNHSAGVIKKTTGYLMQVCFQANVITSAMFLTGISTNPLLQSFMEREGIIVTWKSWAIGAIVPGLISLLLAPLVVYFLHPPAIKSSPEAPENAKRSLKEMGSLSQKEIIMIITFGFLVVCWVLGKQVGLDATATAMIGVAILLVTKVLDWSDVVNEKGAWDTMVWFSIVVMLCGYLADFGTIKWFSAQIGSSLSGYSSMVAVPILVMLYFYLHYVFASVTAHATVLFTTFLFLIMSLGVPPMLAGMVLAYFSPLSGGLTHYSNAVAPIFYENKSINTKEWWKIGFIVSAVNIAIWLGVGSMWWKYLGWF